MILLVQVICGQFLIFVKKCGFDYDEQLTDFIKSGSFAAIAAP